MSATFLVSTLALGFGTREPQLPARPRSVLTLRGGGADELVTGFAGLMGASGLASWAAPKESLEGYGVKKTLTEGEIFFMRAIGGIQMVGAATMLIAKNDGFDKAVWAFPFMHALATLANIPMLESLGAEKGTIIGFVGVMAIFAELSRRGMVPATVETIVLSAIYLLISAYEFFAPKANLAAYGFASYSPLLEGLLKNFDAIKVQIVTFLLVGRATGSVALGLASSCALGVANCFYVASKAEEMGVAKPGLFFWGAVQATLAALAYKP
jgi:hypothetical protein